MKTNMQKNIEIKEFSDSFKNVPKHVRMVIAMLSHSGYEAYLVGGCVRDHIMGRVPSDYDVTTNATPEQIIGLFPRTFYENVYGTVGVVTISEEEGDILAEKAWNNKDTDKNTNKSVTHEKSKEETIEIKENLEDKENFIKEYIAKVTRESIIEVTPYRLESEYTDGRRPDAVKWSQNIHDDLKRRDFTCNAIAYDIIKDILIDNFDGIRDIKSKTLRCVGSADERFKEDALRLIRAVRFAGQLNFEIENITRETLKANVNLLKNISHERI